MTDARVLVVDNFDSFVYNLVQYLGQLGVRCIVRRNDAVDVDELSGLDVEGEPERGDRLLEETDLPGGGQLRPDGVGVGDGRDDERR